MRRSDLPEQQGDQRKSERGDDFFVSMRFPSRVRRGVGLVPRPLGSYLLLLLTLVVLRSLLLISVLPVMFAEFDCAISPLFPTT